MVRAFGGYDWVRGVGEEYVRGVLSIRGNHDDCIYSMYQNITIVCLDIRKPSSPSGYSGLRAAVRE